MTLAPVTLDDLDPALGLPWHCPQRPRLTALAACTIPGSRSEPRRPPRHWPPHWHFTGILCIVPSNDAYRQTMHKCSRQGDSLAERGVQLVKSIRRRQSCTPDFAAEAITPTPGMRPQGSDATARVGPWVSPKVGPKQSTARKRRKG